MSGVAVLEEVIENEGQVEPTVSHLLPLGLWRRDRVTAVMEKEG